MAQQIIKVFISSPFRDLQAERSAVKQAIEDANQILVDHGVALVGVDLQKGARPKPPVAECLEEVTSSHLFIGLLGFRYGSIDAKTGKSISELEYDGACQVNHPILMYVRHPESLVTIEYTDTDQEIISKREAFQKKFEENHKRDTFKTSDELRAHILRDLLHTVLNSEELKKLVPVFGPKETPVVVSEFFKSLESKNIQRCVEIALDNKVEKELRRLGATSIRMDMLKELLGFSSLESVSLVESPDERGPLLIELAEINKSMAYSCLTEAHELALRVKNFKALTNINRDLSNWCLERGKLKDAKKYVAKALRYAKLDSRPHTLAIAFRAKGRIYHALKENRKALKCYWKSINLLCMEKEICFFCLANSFVGASLAHWALHECVLARDRLGKALYLGLTLPARSIQKDALWNLAAHFEAHADYLKDDEERKRAVAAYVWYVQVAKELDPEDDEADLNVVLQDMMVKIGRDKTYGLCLSVRNNAKEIVLAALSEYKLEEFISGIGAKASQHGDHW